MEWVVIGVALLILFGAKKIPELMKGVGKGVQEFNNAKDDVRKQFEESVEKK